METNTLKTVILSEYKDYEYADEPEVVVVCGKEEVPMSLKMFMAIIGDKFGPDVLESLGFTWSGLPLELDLPDKNKTPITISFSGQPFQTKEEVGRVIRHI